LQVHVNCPAAVATTDAVPVPHKPADGASWTATLLAAPHVPFTICKNVAVTVQSATTAAVVYALTPEPVAAPPHPLMLPVM
jgi:hypothetical protein